MGWMSGSRLDINYLLDQCRSVEIIEAPFTQQYQEGSLRVHSNPEDYQRNQTTYTSKHLIGFIVVTRLESKMAKTWQQEQLNAHFLTHKQ